MGGLTIGWRGWGRSSLCPVFLKVRFLFFGVAFYFWGCLSYFWLSRFMGGGGGILDGGIDFGTIGWGLVGGVWVRCFA